MSQDLRGHYAGFATRVVAYFVDLAVIAVSIGVTVWLMSVARSLLEIMPWVSIPVVDDVVQVLLSGTLIGVIAIVYFIFFWSVAGQTPGLRFMGLRVVISNGGRPSGKRALLRMVGYFIATLPFFLGFAWVLIDDRRQGWHDKLARTFVIYDWQARFGGQIFTRALDRREERVQNKDALS